MGIYIMTLFFIIIIYMIFRTFGKDSEVSELPSPSRDRGNKDDSFNRVSSTTSTKSSPNSLMKIHSVFSSSFTTTTVTKTCTINTSIPTIIPNTTTISTPTKTVIPITSNTAATLPNTSTSTHTTSIIPSITIIDTDTTTSSDSNIPITITTSTTTNTLIPTNITIPTTTITANANNIPITTLPITTIVIPITNTFPLTSTSSTSAILTTTTTTTTTSIISTAVPTSTSIPPTTTTPNTSTVPITTTIIPITNVVPLTSTSCTSIILTTTLSTTISTTTIPTTTNITFLTNTIPTVTITDIDTTIQSETNIPITTIIPTTTTTTTTTSTISTAVPTNNSSPTTTTTFNISTIPITTIIIPITSTFPFTSTSSTSAILTTTPTTTTTSIISTAIPTSTSIPNTTATSNTSTIPITTITNILPNTTSPITTTIIPVTNTFSLITTSSTSAILTTTNISTTNSNPNATTIPTTTNIIIPTTATTTNTTTNTTCTNTIITTSCANTMTSITTVNTILPLVTLSTASAPSSVATTSSQGNSTFPMSTLRKLRVDEICKKQVRSAFQEVFNWGSNKDPNHTLKDHFVKTRAVTSKQLKMLSKPQREKIEKETKVDDFDITLLYSCIQLGCEGLADPNGPDKDKWTTDGDHPEYLLYRCKKIRNDLSHEDPQFNESDFMEIIEEMRNLVNKFLEATGKLFNKDDVTVQSFIDNINTNINKTRDDPLSTLGDISDEQEQIRQRLQEILKTNGREDLIQSYTKKIQITPNEWITGDDLDTRLDQVFIPVRLTDGSRQGTQQNIKYEDLLESFLAEQDQQSGQVKGKVLLVEGKAGAGKTTLKKQMISHWISGNKIMKNITSYDLLILMDCKNLNISSIPDLLGHLMPKTKQKFQNTDLLPSFHNQHVLLIVDSLDEMNKVSNKLFLDFLDIKDYNKLNILVFTRPEKVEEFYNMIPNYLQAVHLKIKGITKEQREQFVEGYHKEIKSQGKSQQDTKGLLDHLNIIESHFRGLLCRPLYLVMLTILLSTDSERGKDVASATELHVEILRLSIEKLLSRLDRKKTMRNKIGNFLLTISRQSLECLIHDSIVLTPDMKDQLNQKSAALDLPCDEVTGAFLDPLIQWTNFRLLLSITFPDRDQMEVLAALFMHHKLLTSHKKINDENDKANEKQNYTDMQTVSECLELPQRSSTEAARKSCPPSPRSVLKRCLSSKTEAVSSRLDNQNIVTKSKKAVGKFFNRLKGETSIKKDAYTPSYTKDSRDSSPSTENQNAINDIIKDIYHNKLENLKLENLQNTFRHMLGMMSIYEEKAFSTAAKELIKLLQQSGVSTSWQWLTLLSSTECNDFIIQQITENVKILGEEMRVSDNHVCAAIKLFKHVTPTIINIEIHNDPKTVTCLEELLRVLLEHQEKVTVQELLFESAWRSPGMIVEDTFIDVIRKVFKSCSVKEYHGRASWIGDIDFSLASLPYAKVSVFDEKDANTLKNLNKKLQMLRHLKIHVMTGFDPKHLTPLSSMMEEVLLHLIASNAGNVDADWVACVAKAIQPEDANWSYTSLRLVNSTVTSEGCEQLIISLQDKGIKISESGVYVSSPFLDDHDVQQLNDSSRDKLKCNFHQHYNFF